MKKNVLVVVSLLCLMLTGCTFPVSKLTSMNMRCSYSRVGTDLATTSYLDNIAVEKYDLNKAGLIEVALKLKDFVDTGAIIDLPVDVAKTKIEDWMISKGWGAYTGIVETVFAYVKTQSVDVGVIGVNNIAVIKAGLDQIITAAGVSKKEWRPDIGAAKCVPATQKNLKIDVKK